MAFARLVFLSGLLIAAQAAADLPGPPLPPSPMQREWFDHRDLPWDPAPPVPFWTSQPRARVSRPPVTVMGYLPYWNVGKPTLVLHLDRLHILAYFGASLAPDGTIGDLHHWGGDTLAALLAEAHAAGVLVVLCVTNFDADSIGAFLSSPSARAAAVSALVSLVVSAGGDGVNVDFEGLPRANKADLVGFVADLKQALDAALGRSHVSLATPAVDWSGAWDYDRLAETSDGLFIMGYDYHWPGGPPGPVSPLAPSATWGKYSLSWTIDDYIEWGGDPNRPRFILGLPLYGDDWPTTGPGIPGTATGKAEARFYARCQTEAALYGPHWDADSSTPYYLYQDNGWHQVWCENRQSLALKYALIAARGLGGVGFWALGYEEDLDEVWDELDAAFPPAPTPPDGVAPDATPDPGGESPVESLDATSSGDVPRWEITPDLATEDLPPEADPRPTATEDLPPEADPRPTAAKELPPEADPRPAAHCASGCRASAGLDRAPPAAPLAFVVFVLIVGLRRRGPVSTPQRTPPPRSEG